MLVEHGAVASVMAYDYEFLDEQYNHYQPESSEMEPNQAITIIGWDDRRITQSSSRGAWICKNSWGSNWGNNGFFWVSYKDKYTAKHDEMGAVAFCDVRKPEFDQIYSHDFHGWVDTLYNVDAVINHFVAVENEYAQHVSIVTVNDSVTYDINIYRNLDDGLLSEHIFSQSGFIANRGFHIIDMDSSISYLQNENIYIQLQLSDSSYAYDRTHSPYVLNSDELVIVESMAYPDQSYYLNEDEWKDFFFYDDPYGINNTGNFCIKMYANTDYSIANKNTTKDESVVLHCSGNQLSISSEETFDLLRIFDLQGRLIFSKPMASSSNNEFCFINHGVFIYHLSNSMQSISGKFIAP